MSRVVLAGADEDLVLRVKQAAILASAAGIFKPSFATRASHAAVAVPASHHATAMASANAASSTTNARDLKARSS